MAYAQHPMAIAPTNHETLKWLFSHSLKVVAHGRCLVALPLPVYDKNSNKVEVHKFNEHTKQHSSYVKNYTLLYIITSDNNDDRLSVMLFSYIS